MHSVVGRKVFQTWYIASNLLMSQGHSLQDKIYEVILNRGVGTLFPFKDFNPTEFEKAITSHPKIVLKYD